MEVPQDELVWSMGIGLIGVLLLSILVFMYSKKNKNNIQNIIRVIGQRRKLRRQGISGPPPSLLHGNELQLKRIVAPPIPVRNYAVLSHDFVPTVFPYFHQWAKEYGKVYTYTIRNKLHLYVNSPEMVREMNQNMSTDMGKPTDMTQQLFPLFGNGILRANGPLWSRQRKIIAPEFYMDKLKGMVGLMREASELLMNKWEGSICDGGGGTVEVRVDEDLRNFSADVIARACFGSSYAKGKQIFSKIRTLQKMLSSQGRFIFSNSESSQYSEIMRVEKEVNSLIWDTVQERGRDANAKDLLQLLLRTAHSDIDADVDVDARDGKDKDLIVDNCKNIYFAGHETTAVSSAWCLVLLASYPEWQTRLRHEILEEPQQPPTLDALNRMKWLRMFIQETLRLYGPGGFVTREALQDVRVGEVVIPKGVHIWTIIPALHRDPELWGPDALQFKPERFAGGVSNACKLPQAYIPFGVGPRNCLGKNFAMLELKLLLSHILSSFTFSLSPNYCHSPALSMVIEPANGVYLLIHKFTV